MEEARVERRKPQERPAKLQMLDDPGGRADRDGGCGHQEGLTWHGKELHFVPRAMVVGGEHRNGSIRLAYQEGCAGWPCAEHTGEGQGGRRGCEESRPQVLVAGAGKGALEVDA